MSLFVVRAFVRLRGLMSAHREIAEKIAELERRLDVNDTSIHHIVAAIKLLMSTPKPLRRKAGFCSIDAAPTARLALHD